MSVQRQTPPTQAADSHSMSKPVQTPPIQAADSHPIASENLEDLAESKSSASRFGASSLNDGGLNAETLPEDMFIFSSTNFTDLWDVCASFDIQQQPEVEVKEFVSSRMKSAGCSGPPASSFRSHRWAPSTPIPRMMQTIGPVPVPEEGHVRESDPPFFQGHPYRVLGLPIVVLENSVHGRRPYHFRSKFLCQLNPLTLRVMEVQNADIPSDEEWKLRDLLERRTEKLRVLILMFDARLETVLAILGRLEDLFTDVTTVVLGDACFRGSVYVIELISSENRFNMLAMLLKSFTFQNYDEESFVKTMAACITQNESWRVVEATVEFDPSLHELVSAFSESPNIHFSSYLVPSMNRKMKNKLSNLAHISNTPIDLSDFRNLRSLLCHGRFLNSPLLQSHGLRHLDWFPFESTRFNDCAWGCLSNLQCLSIDGSKLPPSSRISVQCFPKLVSLCATGIAKNVSVDFGHLPLRLNDLQLVDFQGSLEGSDQLWIEMLNFFGPVCSNAYLQLCPKSERVEIEVSDIEDVCRRLSLVADQLKCLKLTLKLDEFLKKSLLPFGAVGRMFPLLESLELVRCDILLSAVTFPRLHYLSLDRCDVLFPKSGIVGQYGDSFQELLSLAIMNCKLLLDKAVPENDGRNSVGSIHLQANLLFSLKLVNVSHLKMLQIHRHSFPRLQSLQCLVVDDDDFPFPLQEPGVPLFPHLRNLSLRKSTLDGKMINLDLLADMGKLEKLELRENAFFTVSEMKPMQCRWVHFSSNVIEQEMARRYFPGRMAIPVVSSAERVAFARSLTSGKCEKFIIDQHVVCLPDRHLVQSSRISVPLLSEQKQTLPTQTAKAHPIASDILEDLAESKSSASRFAASMLDDGGQNVETPNDDLFIFSDTTFQDLWDVCDGFNVEKPPDVEMKVTASTKMNNAEAFGTPVSNLRYYSWPPSTPIPGMMQTIGLIPVSEDGLVKESAFPVSQGLPERVLGLTIVAWDVSETDRKPFFFKSKFLCQLNPLMLPVMSVHNADTLSEMEWKLRKMLAKRMEKLRVLILLFDEDENVKTFLASLGRLEDLLSDVTTVVLKSCSFGGSVYVIDLTFSRNRLNRIAMLVNSLTFHHDDEESFVRTMSACTAQHENWHVIEATVQFFSSLHDFVCAYPKSPNICFSSRFTSSMNREIKNELSTLMDMGCRDDSPIDLSEFENIRELFSACRFISSPLLQSHGLRDLCWWPSQSTRFNDCAWGCLSNLQFLSIHGENLQPNSRISLQFFPKLVSLSLSKIAESVVVDFGHLSLRLNVLQFDEFRGSFDGVGLLQIDNLLFFEPVCDDAYYQLCPISETVGIIVCDTNVACHPLPSIADQLKCLRLSFWKPEGNCTLDCLPFNSLDTIYCLLESLELVCCSMMLSAVTLPRLRHLSLDGCDVLLPKSGIVGQYGNSFQELLTLAITNCKLLLDKAVPENDGRNSVGSIHLQANSLFSLKLVNVSHLKILKIHGHSFSRLQSLQCHVANDDDFPFPLEEPGVPLFPHLRNLSLRKSVLDGKMINLDLLADLGKLENVELLDNAFFTLNDMRPIQCRWVHFSPAIVEQQNARRRPAVGMPISLKSYAEMVTFAISLVGERCEKLIINQDLCFFRDRANIKTWYPPMFGFKQTSMNPAEIESMVEQRGEFERRREKRNPPLPARNNLVDQAMPDPVEKQICRIG